MIKSNKKCVALLILLLGPTARTGEAQQFRTPQEIKAKARIIPLNPMVFDLTEDGNLDLIIKEGFFQWGGSGNIIRLNDDLSVRSIIALPPAEPGIVAKIFPATLNDDIFGDLVVVDTDANLWGLVNQGYNISPKFKVIKLAGSMMSSIARFEKLIIRSSAIVSVIGKKDFLWCGGLATVFGPPRQEGLYITPEKGYSNTILIQPSPVIDFRAKRDKNRDVWMILSRTKDKYSVHIQATKGRISFSTLTWCQNEHITGVELGDVNGDGYLDLDCRASDKLYYELGSKSWVFKSRVEVPLRLRSGMETATSVACEDFDNDGIADFAVSTNLLGRFALYLYKGTSSGSYTKSIISSQQKYVTQVNRKRQIKVVDLDRNGSPDFIISDISLDGQPIILTIKNKGAWLKEPFKYGSGTPAISPPRISLIGEVKLGATIGITLNNTPANAWASLNIGNHTFKGLRGFPIIPWLDIRVFPVHIAVIVKTSQYGQATVFLPLPKDKIMIGMRLALQWLVLDENNVARPIRASKALERRLR